MFKTNFFRTVFIVIASQIGLSAHAQVECELDNSSLQAMPNIEVTITRLDGTKLSMPAKLANTDVTRAAGFQNVCESTIEAMPILFSFEIELVPNFHMNNVVAPIDIAFIDKDGRFDSIQFMKPYSILQINKPLYTSKEPINYALEVHQGFFEKHNVSSAARMTWTQPSAE